MILVNTLAFLQGRCCSGFALPPERRNRLSGQQQKNLGPSHFAALASSQLQAIFVAFPVNSSKIHGAARKRGTATRVPRYWQGIRQPLSFDGFLQVFLGASAALAPASLPEIESAL